MSAIPRAAAFLLTFALLDTGGAFKTGASGIVSKISKDGAAAAATTNAPAEVDAGDMPGVYALQLTAAEMTAQVIDVYVTATDCLGVHATIATDPDIYTAKISLTIDAGNVTDRWEVSWFKNAVPYAPTAGTPQLHVIKASDGSDLIAASNMTQIGATGRWRYDAVTTARTTAAATYIAVATATIDGATRTFEETKGVSRDA